MPLITLMDEHPLAMDSNGKLKSRIATLFTNTQTMVTVPGVHATQRLTYLRRLQEQRLSAGGEPLSECEQETEIANSVDLVMEGQNVLIRPIPGQLDLAFRADEQLQGLIPKRQIQFLSTSSPIVRQAIKRRGEMWRITPPARSVSEMKKQIQGSRFRIGCSDLYFYNRDTGTRYLTFESFSQLSTMTPENLRAHLKEIAEFSPRINRLGNPEIRFFMADSRFSADAFRSINFDSLDETQLGLVFRDLEKRFHDAVEAVYRQDDPLCGNWRNRLISALTGQGEDEQTEETQLGLSPEFFMQVNWLPGARIEDGELLFDAVLDSVEQTPGDADQGKEEEEKCRAFIGNFVREYGDIEYVNVGQVIGSLSSRTALQGRRDVYVAELKLPDQEVALVKLIRMQKFGVREHLDEGMDLLGAMLNSEEYTAYTLDRRIGCRQLGMNLPQRVISRRLSEAYRGAQTERRGTLIWSPYFEREFVYGVATDKISPEKFADPDFAIPFARLLGAAAAPNLILGRATFDNTVIFDDGDEVVVQDKKGLPIEIIVADHTGTFADYTSDLREIAKAYSKPINCRIALVRDPSAFSKAYLDAFRDRLAAIQQRYFAKKRAFDGLFRHGYRDENGNFLFRWDRVLARLSQAQPAELATLIQETFIART